jgi:hypothetical protein
MDAEFYLARDCINKILEELRHNTAPSLETFMHCVDFMLDHTAAVTTLMAAYPKPDDLLGENFGEEKGN